MVELLLLLIPSFLPSPAPTEAEQDSPPAEAGRQEPGGSLPTEGAGSGSSSLGAVSDGLAHIQRQSRAEQSQPVPGDWLPQGACFIVINKQEAACGFGLDK